MAAFKSDFIHTLHERGFIHQCSNIEELDALAASEMMTAYIGFDCTAKSFHVGNLTQMMKLYWFQQTGHRAITLMGGGTTMIGDPSGKEETRQLRSREDIEKNKQVLRTSFERFLEFGDSGNQAIMADNADWLLELNYVDLLRTVGRHFSVNAMLQRDSVRLRLEREQHLSFLEFNYMILQAYDFVELNKRYDCRMQMGGSDQWGNIISGVDLGGRMGTAQLYALTSPLLTTSSGAKMGKTAQGAVWLNADMLSPYDYWQYWRNTEDNDVVRFMKIFTAMPMDEIAHFEGIEGAELNEVKKILATLATAMVHGQEAADLAAQTAENTFEKGSMDTNLPRVNISESELSQGFGILNGVTIAGLAQSNSEVRRHIKGGAIRINDHVISDEKMILSHDHVKDGVIKVSMGKKKHVLLVITEQ